VSEADILMRSTFLIPFLCAATTSSAALHFRYDPGARRYSVETSGVAIEKARLGIEINGTVRWAGDARHTAWNGGTEARFDFTEALRWTVRFRQREDALEVTSTVENTGANPVKLGRCLLIDVSHESGRIGMAPDTTALVLTASQYPERVVRLAQLKQPLESKVLTQWFSPDAGAALQFGFVSFDRAETAIASGWDPSGTTPVVSAWSDFKGFDLAPHASIESETLRIGLERDPYGNVNK
jgi:hypothetical protein